MFSLVQEVFKISFNPKTLSALKYYNTYERNLITVLQPDSLKILHDLTNNNWELK